MDIDQTVLLDPVALLQVLVAINTVNPPGNESLICDLLEGPLEQCGFYVERSPLSDGRDNLIAYPKASADSLLCFTGHLDVVPTGNSAWSYSPFSGHIADGRVYGRGSSDMKGGIAAFLSAVARFVAEHRRAPKVLIILTAGEETGCEGARSLVHLTAQRLPVTAMIIGEPTANALVVGHKGALWLNAEVNGVTAHGSMPELGDNAIYHATDAICKLRHYSVLPEHSELLGNSSINVGTIRGGMNVNSVPDHTEFEVDIRTVGVHPEGQLIEDVQRYLGKKVRLRTNVDAPSLQTDPTDPWVKSVGNIIEAVTGITQTAKTVSFFSDGPALQDILGRVPAVVLGPGEPSMAHKVDEYCEIKKIKECSEIYFRLIEKL
jgi:succinyl-diaminopimelate desuccinylase